MKCNSNCSCNQSSNRRGNNGCNFQHSNNQSADCNNGFQDMFRRPDKAQHQCNVFAAGSSTPQTLTPTGPTTPCPSPSPLIISKVLYDYGCAIQATSGCSEIRITKPGIYQVSYFVAVTNKGLLCTDLTTSLLRNTTQFATSETEKIEPCSTSVFSASEIFYVSCQDMPATLTLQALSTSHAPVTYEFFITINRICTCSEANEGALGVNNCCRNNNFPGCCCESNCCCNDFGPGFTMQNQEFGCANGFADNFRFGCGSPFNNCGCGRNSCNNNNGCGCNC